MEQDTSYPLPHHIEEAIRNFRDNIIDCPLERLDNSGLLLKSRTGGSDLIDVRNDKEVGDCEYTIPQGYFKVHSRLINFNNFKDINWDNATNPFRSLEDFIESTFAGISEHEVHGMLLILSGLFIYKHPLATNTNGAIYEVEIRRAFLKNFLNPVICFMNHIMDLSEITRDKKFTFVDKVQKKKNLDATNKTFLDSKAKTKYKGYADVNIELQYEDDPRLVLKEFPIEVKSIKSSKTIRSKTPNQVKVEDVDIYPPVNRQNTFYNLCGQNKSSMITDLLTTVCINYNDISKASYAIDIDKSIGDQTLVIDDPVDVHVCDSSSSHYNGISLQLLLLLILFDMMAAQLSDLSVSSIPNRFNLINAESDENSKETLSNLLKAMMDDIPEENLETFLSGGPSMFASFSSNECLKNLFKGQFKMKLKSQDIELKSNRINSHILEIIIKDSITNSDGSSGESDEENASFNVIKVFYMNDIEEIQWTLQDLLETPKMYQGLQQMILKRQNLKLYNLSSQEDDKITTPKVLKAGMAKFLIEDDENNLNPEVIFGPFLVLRYNSTPLSRSSKPLGREEIKLLHKQIDILHKKVKLHHRKLNLKNLFCYNGKVHISNFDQSTRVSPGGVCSFDGSETSSHAGCNDYEFISQLYEFARTQGDDVEMEL
ncbi:hypothetical protein BN7_6429 [Wickerhamomyces ciferrii]|uniref:Uncharacterized protein n=1 Tax=Wickerhamomyces ciferrii (strain ATCC 14091 / BCRC 22168 / CBS 111 / JCM 3599 / NBRC 0793 / NRRL Y-1031 F-60-10) TaxID=1206466 RepID=K0KZR9_WICCF|nr:uncharacterized protein BN7_6429 [Wickerhamomyces ciferrii]CCH46829.1 hypothetical protein BN7_6429 [Wickerhamomyces ciferrii]